LKRLKFHDPCIAAMQTRPSLPFWHRFVNIAATEYFTTSPGTSKKWIAPTSP